MDSLPSMNPIHIITSVRLSPWFVGLLTCLATMAIGLPAAFLLFGCGPGAPGAPGGSGPNAGDTCHIMSELSCVPEARNAAGSCETAFGAAHHDPIVCEGVFPDGNCLALGELATASCEGGDVAGAIWCCGENSSESCLPFDDAACDGATAADLAGRCEELFGGDWSTLYTCAAEDGPATCKNLLRGSVTCGGEARDVWCCTAATP